MTEPQFTRPVRGAVRLDALSWDVQQIKDEVTRIRDDAWQSRPYGDRWSDVALYLRGQGSESHRHPMLENSPGLTEVLTAFPGPVVDMCLASLAPGGRIKEHRDISGGAAAGITRFHIPVITHQDVAFFVSGERVFMDEGEVWHLDTTYRHKVANESDVTRIHLIVDLETTPALLKLLPAPDWRDRLHKVFFWLVCVRRGVVLSLTNPAQAKKRLVDFFRLVFQKQSVLYKSDDIAS